MFEEALDGEVEPATIGALTDAMTRVLGDDVHDHLAVTIVGIPTGRSGVGGEPV
jgi:hypothetical protein